MDVLPQQMFNLRPFVSVTDDAAEPICKIKCGCRLATAVGHPSLTSSFDGKTLSLWLLPGRNVVALRLGDHGTTYHWKLHVTGAMLGRTVPPIHWQEV